MFASLSSLWRFAALKPLLLPKANRWPLVIGVIFGVWVSFYLYVDTLSVPYLQEDVSHINWLASRNPIELFFSAKGAPAYRPLGKSIIKIWYLILGEHFRPWLRYQNILLNTLSIALIGHLGAKLDSTRQRYWTGGVAALLFSAYPFSYQAIPWINNFFYPMENFLLLVMLALYWRGREVGSKALIALSIFFCALAPFEIEYGVVGAGLLMVLEFYFWLRKRQPWPFVLAPLIGLLFNIGYTYVWFNIPKESYEFGGPTVERVYQIAHYFVQGLTYPVSPLAQWLRTQGLTTDFTGIQWVAGPTLLLITIFLWRSKRLLLLLVALSFFFLLNFPALVFVDFDYVVNSPRLLYPAGLAVVWVWGAVAALFFDWGEKVVKGRGIRPNHPHILTPIIGIALLSFTLWSNVNFVRARMSHYHIIEEPVYTLMEAVEQTNTPDEQILVVNFPSWLSPTKRTFAVGNHGIQLIPFYIGLDASILAHTGINQTVRTVAFSNLLDDPSYYYGVIGMLMNYETMHAAILDSHDVYIASYSKDRIELNAAGRILDEPSQPALASFDNSLNLALSGVKLDATNIQANLEWQFLTDIPVDATVFVHLYGADGQLVSQADGDMMEGLAPVWVWEAGQTVLDSRNIKLPNDAPLGAYKIGVGVYNRANGVRFDAVTQTGESIQDNVVIVHEFTR